MTFYIGIIMESLFNTFTVDKIDPPTYLCVTLIKVSLKGKINAKIGYSNAEVIIFTHAEMFAFCFVAYKLRWEHYT